MPDAIKVQFHHHHHPNIACGGDGDCGIPELSMVDSNRTGRREYEHRFNMRKSGVLRHVTAVGRDALQPAGAVAIFRRIVLTAGGQRRQGALAGALSVILNLYGGGAAPHVRKYTPDQDFLGHDRARGHHHAGAAAYPGGIS